MQTRQNSTAPALPAVTTFTNNLNNRSDPAGPSAVAQFVAAKELLLRRRQELEQELIAIATALEPTNLPGTETAQRRIVPPPKTKRSRGELTTTMVELLRGGPLDKAEIIRRLRERMPSLNSGARRAADSVLYGKRFRREGGLFSLAQTPA